MIKKKVIANEVKQSPYLNRLPRILTNARNDIAGQGGFLIRLMSRRNDRNVNCGKRGGLTSHKNLVTWSPDHLVTSKSRKAAFTMAEILLSLTIIGVVAAITLPSLTGNINERTWNTQRKALYSRMSQAVALMPALNGYGIGATEEETKANATETFLSAGLSKVLKINNICDSEHLSDCGVASKFVDLYASKNDVFTDLHTFNSGFNVTFYEVANGVEVGDAKTVSVINTNAAAFETANGESIVAYYNPYCKIAFQIITNDVYTQHHMCANFIFDLNGKKGPNTIGKDVGVMSVFYPSDSVVVVPDFTTESNEQVTYTDAVKICKQKGDDTRLPNLEEMMSLYLNEKYLGIPNTHMKHFWTSKLATESKAYVVSASLGRIYLHDKTKDYYVQCVKC